MACLSSMFAIIIKGRVNMSRSKLLTLNDDRENLGRVFVFAAILTLVIFIIPAPSTEANAKILVATATGIAVGCILIISHALISSSVETVKKLELMAKGDSKVIAKANSKDIAKADKEDPEMSAVTRTPSASSRPSFSKPSRESRARQLQSQVNEFCTLSFDEVEAPEQSGLTCRMLALMNMLSTGVSFWRGEERVEEEAFRILDLSDVDMRAIRCAVNAAAALVESHKFRDAYDLLCSLRLWFVASDASSLELQRGRLREGIMALDLSPDSKGSAAKTGDKSKDRNAQRQPTAGSSSVTKGGSSHGRTRRTPSDGSSHGRTPSDGSSHGRNWRKTN